MNTPALLWRPLGDGTVQCRLCSHFCRIEAGDTGRCGVRRNDGGTLVTLSFGKVAALHLDPVEKKPLFHFLPGSTTLSLGTPGCNLDCAFCQNWTLSQPPRQGLPRNPRAPVRVGGHSSRLAIVTVFAPPEWRGRPGMIERAPGTMIATGSTGQD